MRIMKELVRIVDEIISTFSSEAEEKEIHLSGSMKVTHRNILCDGTKIREIYVNLVSNAMKYNSKGWKCNDHCRRTAM